jgi:capsular polysaccharide transport system permease protein
MSDSTYGAAPAEPSWWAGLRIQIRTLRALAVLHLMRRYGRNNIGFLWLILEPMILCTGVLGLRWFITQHHEHGVDLIPLLVTGYMPLTLWRHLTNHCNRLARQNIGTLYHRRVTIYDIYFTEVLLEFVGCTLASAITILFLTALGVLEPVADYGLLCAGWLMMGLLASSVGLMLAYLTEAYEAAEHFIQPAQYLLLPICGFIFMVDWLPDSTQQLAWWMPMVHCFEMVRAGYFGDAVPTHFTPAYPFVFSLVLFAIYLPKLSKAAILASEG